VVDFKVVRYIMSFVRKIILDIQTSFAIIRSMTMKLHPAVRKFLSSAGQKGGSAKSDKKTEAVRKNGKLGGRPRKDPKSS
jgi:hypothetical protein